MKKLFAILMAVALLCTMSVTAFAANNVTTTGKTSADLTVKYSSGSKVHAYAATIEWGSMEFTYTSAAQKWDTENLEWTTDGTAAWSNAGTVKITNRSSQAITAKFGFTAESDEKGVTGITVNGAAIDANGYSIASADTGDATGTAQTETFSILPTGEYTGTNTDAVKVGTITITLE